MSNTLQTEFRVTLCLVDCCKSRRRLYADPRLLWQQYVAKFTCKGMKTFTADGGLRCHSVHWKAGQLGEHATHSTHLQSPGVFECEGTPAPSTIYFVFFI